MMSPINTESVFTIKIGIVPLRVCFLPAFMIPFSKFFRKKIL